MAKAIRCRANTANEFVAVLVTRRHKATAKRVDSTRLGP